MKMTQHDQNQDAQLDDLFAAARRDAPEPSDAFMQALLDTIPEPNATTAVIEEPVSTGWWQVFDRPSQTHLQRGTYSQMPLP
jgi:hypothetical protein